MTEEAFPEFEPISQADLLASVKRKLIWDIVPCSRVLEFMPKMGVVPGSEEGEAVEHRASHERLNSVLPIVAIVTRLGLLGGEVASRAILENQGIEPTDAVIQQQSLVAAGVTQAVIANLIEMGLIDITGKVYRGLLG